MKAGCYHHYSYDFERNRFVCTKCGHMQADSFKAEPISAMCPTPSADKDPTGRSQHAPGAKLDGGKIRPALVLGAFSRALQAVSGVGTFGAKKYSDNGWLSVPDAQQRYTDALLRHYLAEAAGEHTDPESHLAHAAHLAWNALARLELMMREHDI